MKIIVAAIACTVLDTVLYDNNLSCRNRKIVVVPVRPSKTVPNVFYDDGLLFVKHMMVTSYLEQCYRYDHRI